MSKYYIRVKEETNILHTIKRRKANWIGNIFCRNCLLKQVIQGKIEKGFEVMGRQGKRHDQLVDDLKERTRYWRLKEEARDCTMWRTYFSRGYRPTV
jgi:phage gp16-like protein